MSDELIVLPTCKWCEEGDEPKILDNDGALISISGEEGTLCHAHEEYWWPCLRFGKELHTALPSIQSPTIEREAADERYRAGMLHAVQLCEDEFKRSPEVSKNYDGQYMSGYEDACDHLSIAIKQASIISCVPAVQPASTIEREAAVQECERFLKSLSDRTDERRDGAFVAITRLKRNIASLPAVQPLGEQVRALAEDIRRSFKTRLSPADDAELIEIITEHLVSAPAEAMKAAMIEKINEVSRKWVDRYIDEDDPEFRTMRDAATTLIAELQSVEVK